MQHWICSTLVFEDVPEALESLRDPRTHLETAKSEERAAHKLLMAKEREIDSAVSLLNLARNAITVEDVDNQMRSMEHKMEHETLNLTEEKRMLGEIRKMKQQREQLAANAQSQQELQHALDRRVETEEHLKNKVFYHYKDAVNVAYDLAGAGKKDSLEQHCLNQVEKFMQLWNNNDEFQKECIKRNERSTLRRFRTKDCRTLGPDEEPPSMENVFDIRQKFAAKVNSVGTVPTLERSTSLQIR